jgi:hypothetical protein
VDSAADSAIAAAFQNGAPDALALVYQRYARLVCTVAMRSVRVNGRRTGCLPPS